MCHSKTSRKCIHEKCKRRILYQYRTRDGALKLVFFKRETELIKHRELTLLLFRAIVIFEVIILEFSILLMRGFTTASLVL